MALLIRKRFTTACMKPCTYRDGQKFAFLFEVRKPDGLREYRLAEADKLLGPWANVPDWTVTASHGELLRSGIDEHPEVEGRSGYCGLFCWTRRALDGLPPLLRVASDHLSRTS